MRKVTKREEEYSAEDKVAVKMPGPGLGVGQKEEWRTQKDEKVSFSRGSSCPRDLTQVSCISGRFFTI